MSSQMFPIELLAAYKRGSITLELMKDIAKDLGFEVIISPSGISIIDKEGTK